MKYTLALLLFIAAPAAAQSNPTMACGIDTKIFGCVDLPTPGATVHRDNIVLQGWALSCYTAQQPSAIQVYYLGEANAFGVRPIKHASADDFTIVWRGQRTDVFNYYRRYCNITTANWGYALQIDGSKLPLGPNVIAIQFFDPAVGVGVSIQQVAVVVVP